LSCEGQTQFHARELAWEPCRATRNRTQTLEVLGTRNLLNVTALTRSHHVFFRLSETKPFSWHRQHERVSALSVRHRRRAPESRGGVEAPHVEALLAVFGDAAELCAHFVEDPICQEVPFEPLIND
jgi:hypothetical protein